jgi:hypothetical protein
MATVSHVLLLYPYLISYIQLFMTGLMSYLRYLCLFADSGVQHILCCVFALFFLRLYCQFLWSIPTSCTIHLVSMVPWCVGLNWFHSIFIFRDRSWRICSINYMTLAIS